MHEVSIAQSLLDIAISECEKAGYSRINSISVVVGEASGVQVDSLKFAFDVIKKDTPADEAELLIDISPLTGVCLECKSRFQPTERPVYECPMCKCRRLKIISGNELDIVEIDVD
ncbi:MAG: hydrogenase maturation nickel metallochaperone HypA [Nitrospirae bacterium]|nr:MAG: hydrogenase maturation nickel metallochaperone HypA [Nitrospirota bacterium]